VIYSSENLYIELEESEIPWFKIFTNTPYKEFSQVPHSVQLEILSTINIIEKLMLDYYQPEKINIASFGNYMPHQHWHVMARFSEDSYYPEPMWGNKQRTSTLSLPNLNTFITMLKQKLNT
jgi:diadenosine tetraphosphate (Ap4A) HIT family hydrolase